MANDVLGNLKSYFSKLTEGEHSAAEMASSLNTWLRESGESIKVKVEEEVHRSVTKMGFIKREEFEALKREVQALKVSSATKKSSPKSSRVRQTAKKKTTPTIAKKPKSTDSKKVTRKPVKKSATTARKPSKNQSAAKKK